MHREFLVDSLTLALWIAIILIIPSAIIFIAMELVFSMAGLIQPEDIVKLSVVAILSFPLAVFMIKIISGKNEDYAKALVFDTRQINIKNFLLCLFLAIAYYTLFEGLSVYLNIPTEPFMEELIQHMSSTIPAIIILVSTCICAPIIEECLFRGLLYSHFMKTRLSLIGAIIIPGLIFSFIHLQYDSFFTFFHLFFGGILFGWIRYKTNGLIFPIIAHSLYNLFALIVPLSINI